MSIRLERPTRHQVAPMVAALASWAPRHGYPAGLHPGDIGWHLRLDDADLVDTMIVALDGHEVVACALAEAGLLRPAFRPDRLDDQAVASALADLAEEMAASTRVWSDAPSESAYRARLAARGWSLDPDPWNVFYRPLTASDGRTDAEDGTTRPLHDDGDIADRVAVQSHAFEHSTFTVARWHQMAAGPGFEPALDLLRHDDDGQPVAAATGWLSGPGRVAILEPVGTHRDHTRAGHGVAVTRATIAALARAEASGVTVCTPAANSAAVRTYLSSGLSVVEQLHALVSPLQ